VVGRRQKSQLQAGSLPEGLRPFFWDVDFLRLSIKGSAHFIISRLMEQGDESGLKFLMHTYDRNEMAKVLATSRTISRRSRAFWRVVLDLDEAPCIPKRYPTPYGK